MKISKLAYVITSLILSIWLSTSSAVWAGGTPAGLTITTVGNEMSVVALNFNNDYTIQEVNEMYSLVGLIYNLLGVEGTVTLYSPDTIKSMGYDADSLHTWLVSILSEFQSYIQIKADKVTNSQEDIFHLLDIWTWSPGDTTGFYIGALIVPDEMALFDLLNILNEGSRYINIVTSAPYNNNITDVIRMDIYYMDSATAERQFLASIEISAQALARVFESILGGGLSGL